MNVNWIDLHRTHVWREPGYKTHLHPVNTKDSLLSSPNKTAWLSYNPGRNLTNSDRLSLANQWFKLQCVRISKMRMMRALLGFVFQLLYHQFAWTYDLVAAVVSLGRWQSWVLSAQPFLSGRVLEIGYGPGHLQEVLHAGGMEAFGLDESRQMSRQASHRLRRKGSTVRLLRGMAQQIPFPDGTFDCVVATFPSETIFEAKTLADIRRVLKPGGKLVIVSSAWITGKGLMERLAAGLFQATGQAGRLEEVLAGMKWQITTSGFEVRHEIVESNGSRVLVIIATK